MFNYESLDGAPQLYESKLKYVFSRRFVEEYVPRFTAQYPRRVKQGFRQQPDLIR